MTVHTSETTNVGDWHVVVTPLAGLAGYQCVKQTLRRVLRRAEEAVGTGS